MPHTRPEIVLNFWFEELTPSDWFSANERVDSLIRERFGELHAKATACELSHLRQTAEGSLAEVLVLDQFSRNLYRGSALSFASDAQALSLAQVAIDKGLDLKLSALQRSFLYMPFMHSESLLIHEQAVRLYEGLGRADNLEFEYRHKRIIERFGRYPHRNEVLGRPSSTEELEFLTIEGSSF